MESLGRGGGLAFVGGNTGREVCVQGTTAGSAALKILLREGERDVPTFSVKVVPVTTIVIRALIVSDGYRQAQTESTVREMVKTASDIYAQIGVRFALESIAVTNLPAAFVITETKMWWCVKRFILVVALALQSLVVVVLWTRLFDLNVSRPSWQAAMIRWSLPAVWITSIEFWQLVFGKRRWIGMTLTTIAACVLLYGCADTGVARFARNRPAAAYLQGHEMVSLGLSAQVDFPSG